MANLVSLNQSSPQMLDKIPTKIFSISRFLVKYLLDKNCHSTRTSYYTDVKLGVLSRLHLMFYGPEIRITKLP